jgi:hypothetical protein
MKKNIFFVIALAFVIAVGIFYYYQNLMTVSTITLDINPSIELSTNNSGKVIKFEALNDDGEIILEGINLKQMTIEEATEVILNRAIEFDYIDMESEYNAILVTVLDDDEENQLEIAYEMEEVIQKAAKEKNINVEVIKQGITEELKDQANEYEISNGKMMFISKVSEKYALDIDDLATLSIKEIQLKIKEVTGNPSVENANDKSKVDMGDQEVRNAAKEEKTVEQAAKKAEKQVSDTVEDEVEEVTD